jgi:hypothetical protein
LLLHNPLLPFLKFHPISCQTPSPVRLHAHTLHHVEPSSALFCLRAHECLPSATNPEGAPLLRRPISAPKLHPAFPLQRPSTPPAEGAPRRATRLSSPILANIKCAPRSYTPTAAATRPQTGPRAPHQEAQTVVSPMSRRSSTRRSVIAVTGRGTDPPPRASPRYTCLTSLLVASYHSFHPDTP